MFKWMGKKIFTILRSKSLSKPILMFSSLVPCFNVTVPQYSEGMGHLTGQCKSTGGCYNELVVAYFGTGGGVKWRKR